MTNRPAALFDQVVKEYPQKRSAPLRALDNVSLRIEPGEVFGLIGPNRAGKTTLVKLLLSLCRPTQGRVERLGQDSSVCQTLARIGYVHENPAFPRYHSATALLEFYGALSLLDEKDVRKRVPQLLSDVGLADRAKEPIARFSKGMLQRLGLAQALLTEPELLVLDEPSEGLDLNGRQLLRRVITEQRKRGAVLYVTHLLGEVEQSCDRIGVLVGGRLEYTGTVLGLTNSTRTLEEAVKEYYQSPSLN